MLTFRLLHACWHPCGRLSHLHLRGPRNGKEKVRNKWRLRPPQEQNHHIAEYTFDKTICTLPFRREFCFVPSSPVGNISHPRSRPFPSSKLIFFQHFSVPFAKCFPTNVLKGSPVPSRMLPAVKSRDGLRNRHASEFRQYQAMPR